MWERRLPKPRSALRKHNDLSKSTISPHTSTFLAYTIDIPINMIICFFEVHFANNTRFSKYQSTIKALISNKIKALIIWPCIPFSKHWKFYMMQALSIFSAYSWTAKIKKTNEYHITRGQWILYKLVAYCTNSKMLLLKLHTTICITRLQTCYAFEWETTKNNI